MAKPVRIAVLSDLHIWSSVDEDSLDNALEAFDAAVATKPDHVVIAGDTFDCSTAFDEDSGRVRSALKKRGLWKPEKLSIVVGNHDIFHSPHRGSLIDRGLEWSNVRKGDAQGSYETFCEWAGALVPKKSRLSTDDIFPFEKRLRHVVLLGADTTARVTIKSANGYWNREEDKALRGVDTDGARTVLAIHNAPYESGENAGSPGEFVRRFTEEDFEMGFPEKDYERLESFADDTGLNAIVCGHIHAGADAWAWTVGEKTKAFMVGRTGGVHGARRCIGVLEIPATGKLKWETVRF